ncbi:gamma-glutamyltransferase family protein [Prosthecomicrobium sp. N25]|uniref:gamma-glutamyltransferase family protein n=1 Tax=Prosthecomicrobium sp. N25 TaxID=3129254 RepID=UPI00307851E7
MLETKRSHGGMVTAPHDLAARAGARVLEDGGTAIEAMVAAAAAIAVAYPHMNGLGGDNFWIVSVPGRAPAGIDACGAAAGLASPDFYAGETAIPARGARAALTVAGAVSGWARALALNATLTSRPMPLARLFEDAIRLARDGVAVTRTLARNAAEKAPELDPVPGFRATYAPEGRLVAAGDRLRQVKVADTLEHLARAGLDDFYRGDLARSLAGDLEAAGSPLRLADLERHRALDVEPLSVAVGPHRAYNLPPPTQGLASLMILGIFARLGVTTAEGIEHVHGLVEATKQAFLVRDRHVCDPAYMTRAAIEFLADDVLDAAAARIDRGRALPWPQPAAPGDTVWLGAIDREGRAVSFIQSVYWEFGSGLVLPGSGVTWQNRGTSFSLTPGHFNGLKPFRRPFHTIQPAFAELGDGRRMVYGTMGGEGQPQTQAAVFSRYALFGSDLQAAVTAPRWLLGRTWGAATSNLKIESRLDAALVERLRAAGHEIQVVGPFEEMMGHAGAIVLHPGGLIEGAADPRSDGAAVGL